MEKSKEFVRTVLVALFAGVLLLTGCGRTDDDSSQVDTAVQYEISEVEPKSTEVQANVDTAQIQNDVQEQGGRKGSIIRVYSDREKDRMAELEQSYQNETAKPENMIQEVDSVLKTTEHCRTPANPDFVSVPVTFSGKNYRTNNAKTNTESVSGILRA